MDKFVKFFKLIQARGGFLKSLGRIYVMDDLKTGRLVGSDKYGHKYYENREYFFGRHRWIEYSEAVHVNYEASMVPSGWYGWLHNTTDLTPDQDCSKPNHCWMLDHTMNLTGMDGQYVPYSTTRPKIGVWTPPGQSSEAEESEPCPVMRVPRKGPSCLEDVAAKK